MCGSPNDAFWSQAAIFRHKLDSMGEPYRSARQVLCLGAAEPEPVPARWQPWFERIELRWTDRIVFEVDGDRAQAQLLYGATSTSADLSIICDADTLLLNRLPDDFLEDFLTEPAMCGVIAHYPPPLTPYEGAQSPQVADQAGLWAKLAETIVGRPFQLIHPYTLAPGTSMESERCPFYINHGFIAARPHHFAELDHQMRTTVPQVRAILDNDFCYQLAIPCAIALAGIPYRVLPMRFNFPNDPVCDQLYPDELNNVVLVHYLRTQAFDRHRIFADPAEFARFMETPLEGSNAIFRESIRTLTNGQYPFPAGRLLRDRG